jgi:hypothetical protein
MRAVSPYILPDCSDRMTKYAVTDDPRQDDPRQNDSQRRSLIALGVVVFLFLVGWILAREIYANGKVEDCVLSGRTNCVPIDTQSR